MNQRSQDTENNRLPHDPATFARNMATVAEQCQRILQEFISRQSMEPGGSSLDPFNLCGAFTEFFTQLVSDPGKLMQKQFDLWQDYMQLWMKTTQRLLGEQEEPIITPDTRDKRFKDKAWQDSTV